MKHLEKDLEKSVWEIIIDLQREIRELEKENKKLKEENKSLKERIDIAKWVPYKNPYNEVIPRDENWFYKEVKPIC